MDKCGDNLEPINTILSLDYLFEKCSWCIKNNFNNYVRLCKYIEQIIHLSDNNFSLDHLFYANDIIEFLAKNFTSETNYLFYFKRMLALCLMPPSVKSIAECSNNLSIMTRFYDVMAKCIWSVRTDVELNILVFGVMQSSVLRRQSVPENSISLLLCYEAIETSDLPTELMQLIDNATTQTLLVDLLKLSHNIAVVSNKSALRMMQSDGIGILVNVLKPNHLWIPVESYERSTVCEFVILLLNQMFTARYETKAATELPQITRTTLEILLSNIKSDTKRNTLSSIRTRNDFCCVLCKILDNCSVNDNEFSDEMITEIVMLCVWPEITEISHWLDDVRFNYVNENFIFKNIMLDIVNKEFINSPRKIKFQQLNTFLMHEFTILLDDEYTKLTYGVNLHTILNRLLMNLPHLLLNSIDNFAINECCTKLLALIKSLQSEERYSQTMINAIICIGIASNDNYSILRTFKTMKADILINSVILDTLRTKDYDFQDISLYGINTLNVFYRENQHNPEIQRMVFNNVMRMIKLYFVVDSSQKINQNILLDFLHFIKNAIIRYVDQVELFVSAGGIEPLLNVLSVVKYPIQLVILTTLIDLSVSQKAKIRIKKWKSGTTNVGYLELMCDLWRREIVRFEFIDDQFMFREQRVKTTVKNVIDGCSPVVESLFLYAQPKIYLLVDSVEFSDEEPAGHTADEIKEKTVKACGLVPGLHDKATVAHIYHYYSLKLCEIWNENEMVISNDPDDSRSPIETQTIKVMTIRHAYLTALIKTIKKEVAVLDVGWSDVEKENKLYEEIRRYHLNTLNNNNL